MKSSLLQAPGRPGLAQLTGLELAGEPVKGQMLCLDAQPGLITGFIHASDAYIVLALDVGYIIGATMVHEGFDRRDDPAAIERLSSRRRTLRPGAGWRTHCRILDWPAPRLNSGRPLIDRIEPGLLIATGHFRNGILLAPLTAEIIAGTLAAASTRNLFL